MGMSVKDIQGSLARLGWPIAVDGVSGSQTKQATKDFQHGYAFESLEVDGIVGPQTEAALAQCLDRDGKCAEFFRFTEFASKGNGWIRVHPQLLRRLDDLRRRTGPINVISGYRDPAHNKAVGGASSSQHAYGTAADIGGVDRGEATDCGFSGTGIAPNGDVVHVDVRAEGPNNTTGGTPGHPTVWYY